MKLKSIKKFTVSIVSIMLLITAIFQMTTFAEPIDVLSLGGMYCDIFEKTNAYLKANTSDTREYVCYRLVSKEALNKWADHIETQQGLSVYNEFLLLDFNQFWVPSIVMEKEDYEKTPTYCDAEKTNDQNAKALKYIQNQANRLIDDGDLIGIIRDEINFIQKTFGNKYDAAIDEAWKYIFQLDINLLSYTVLVMNNPYIPRICFKYYLS